MHSPGRCRLRRPHGGCARPLRRSARSERPVVCFDESPIQLIGEVRQPIAAAPGQVERYDCEYRRNGTANLFVFVDVNRPWRKVKVTERRAAQDFAACVRDLTDIHYPAPSAFAWCSTTYQPIRPARSTKRSLPTKPGGCYAAWSSTTFPNTPAGSIWSNRDRRPRSPMPRSTHRQRRPSPRRDRGLEKRRNADRARIKWMFTTKKARAKMGRAYRKPAASGQTQRVKTSVTSY